MSARPEQRDREAMTRPKRARSHPRTDTAEFKTWFGRSRIVDEHGEPLVVYHGTAARVAVFDPALGDEYGIYVTPSRRYAARYGTPLPLYVRLLYPLEVESKGEISARDFTQADADQLISQGYDGIVSVTPGRPVWKASEMVAFHPEQVRMAVMRFVEHDIEFPEWLAALGFRDESEPSQAVARAAQVLFADRMVCVWVNYEDPEDREDGRYKFAVQLFRRNGGAWVEEQDRAEFEDDPSAEAGIKALLETAYESYVAQTSELSAEGPG
jgi:hypothetical protein